MKYGSKPAVIAALKGGAIEVAIGCLDQARDGDAAVISAAEGIKRGECARRRHFEHRPGAAVGPAVFSCAIQISVSPLHQDGGGKRALETVEGNQRGQCITDHSEDGAIAISSTLKGCAVEIGIGCLHQTRDR